MRLFGTGLFLAIVALAGAWDTKFKSSSCYSSPGSTSATLADLVEDRMPLSMESFVALLEKYERQHTYVNPDAVAESLVNRYRVDGITYNAEGNPGLKWPTQEIEEVDKQTLTKKVLMPVQVVPPDTFDPREECALHFMTSHSTDIYPHPGLDSLWDGRYRRSLYGYDAQNSSSGISLNELHDTTLPEIAEVHIPLTETSLNPKLEDSNAVSSNANQDKHIYTKVLTSTSTVSSNLTFPDPDLPVFPKLRSSGFRDHSDFETSSRAVGRSSLPQGVLPTDHPIENGVIKTPFGPVALGTLLAGIAAGGRGSEVSIEQLYQDDVVYMPQEMKAKRLSPLYAVTLSGDIAQTAVVTALTTTQNKNYIGPMGRFGNSTAAPKIFTLSTGFDGAVAYLTRAEIFAGIDAMLISQALRSQSSRIKLSQVMRMYYSDHGLPGYSQVKACNRMEAYKQLGDDDKIKEQALNFMYAYSHYFSDAQRHIEENSEFFNQIEQFYSSALNNAWSAFTSFVGSYNYEDYDRCPVYTRDNVMCENWSDLLVIYSREGGQLELEKQREYITHVAQKIGVSETRSRLGIMDGKSGNWLLEMTNVSNIADWGSNFTTDTQYNSGGSGGDINLILDKMRVYYSSFYKTMNSTADNATANAQVVVWNVPKNAPDFNNVDLQRTILEFRLAFPNVYFLFVGNNRGAYEPVLKDPEEDFFKLDTSNPELFADTLSKRICQIPTVFVYPACDTQNVNFTNYNEQSHKFTGYISPNYTSYAMIAPHNFRFSYRVKLKVESSDVNVCVSRDSMNLDYNEDNSVVCQDGNSEFEWRELCGRYLVECKPIYLSIRGSATGNQRCTDDECDFPNQLQYTISHDGMLCGAWSPTASLLMMLMLALHLLWY